MDNKTKQAYLNNPFRCPKCASKNFIIGNYWSELDGTIGRDNNCSDCNYTWGNIYTLTDVGEVYDRYNKE